MSNLPATTNVISAEETAVNAVLALNARDAMSEYRESLSEKQAESWDALVSKRQMSVFKNDDDLFAFFAEFKGMAYLEESKKRAGSWVACGLSGNRSKADFHYRFNSHEDAVAHIKKWAKSIIKTRLDKEAAKAQEKDLTARLTEFVSVGDVLKSSWGYDQTNIDYYKVVGFRGKSTLELQSIGSTIVKTYHHDSGEKIPDVDDVQGEIFTRQVRVRKWDFQDGKVCVSVKINSCETASIKHKQADGSYSADSYSWGR